MPVSSIALAQWERLHSPYKLPQSLKSFLSITNGVSLRWDAKWGGPDTETDKTIPIGALLFNSLQDIVPLPLQLDPDGDAAAAICAAFDEVATSDPSLGIKPGTAALQQARWAAFDLDTSCACGRVALFYVLGDAQPQVWFQDLACHWHFLAASFADYFRLAVMHLGLPNWPYIFTPAGLDTASEQWFRYIASDRLIIDMENRREQGRALGGGASRDEERVAGGAARRPLDLESVEKQSSSKKTKKVEAKPTKMGGGSSAAPGNPRAAKDVRGSASTAHARLKSAGGSGGSARS